jgi:hypothetical protein
MIKDEGPRECDRVPVNPSFVQREYVDFMNPTEIKLQNKSGPPKTNFADDLCFYLTNHAVDADLDTGSPSIISIFAQKIIASHYAIHLRQIRQIILKSQIQFRRRSDFMGVNIAPVEANWSDCQTLSKRLQHYCLDLESIIFQFKLPLERPDPHRINSWQDSEVDFQMLYCQFYHALNWVDKVNSSITGLTGIVGNQQALREQQLSLEAADRARNITILGLLFVPLAYVATIFSMSDEYAPGGEMFWLYFAISIPMMGLVFGIYQGVNWARNRK